MNSLRTRLLLLVALSLGPAVLLAAYNGFNERQRAVDSARTALQQITDLAAINEAQFINSARQLLLDLSDAPDLLGEHRDCNLLMRKTLQRNPQYVNFGLIQLNGDITCSAVPSSTLINLADRPHFIDAVKHRRFVVGNHVYGRLVQKHTINLTHPVLDSSGSVVAVVFAALNLGALDEFIRSVTLPEGAILVTLDSQGVIASRRPDPMLWLGKKAEAPLREAAMDKAHRPRELTGPDGVTRLHTFAPVGTGPASNLVLTIGFPTRQILAAAVSEQIFTTAALTVTALLALVAAWLAVEKLIVRRVEALCARRERFPLGTCGRGPGLPMARKS